MAGINFDNIFSLVIKYDSIKTIFAIVVAQKMKMLQFDNGTTYLNGDLYKDICMCQPEGFIKDLQCVCKLIKSLHDLCQSGRQWNIKFHSFHKQHILFQSDANN